MFWTWTCPSIIHKNNKNFHLSAKETECEDNVPGRHVITGENKGGNCGDTGFIGFLVAEPSVCHKQEGEASAPASTDDRVFASKKVLSLPNTKGLHLRIQMENQTALSYLMKLGATKNSVLSLLAKKTKVLLDQEINLRVLYLPGKIPEPFRFKQLETIDSSSTRDRSLYNKSSKILFMEARPKLPEGRCSPPALNKRLCFCPFSPIFRVLRKIRREKCATTIKQLCTVVHNCSHM